MNIINFIGLVFLNSNYQQLSGNYKKLFFQIAVILLAIIRKLISFAVSVHKKRLLAEVVAAAFTAA